MKNAVLKRRSLLKQLGAAAFLATPVFRSVIAEAQTTFPLRLIMLNLPGGIPFRAGSESQLDTYFDGIYSPWASLQSDMIVFDNINNQAGDKVATFWELEGHGGGCRSMFGAAVNDQGCKGTTACGEEALAYRYGTATTLDQHIATAMGQTTPFSSLHFGTLWDKGQGGDHAECWYKNGQAVRPMSDPMTAFSRLFGNGLPSGGGAPPPAPTGTTPAVPAGPDPALVNLYERGKSRLDLLFAEMAEVKAIAGSDEQNKLDQHLTALRELEGKLPMPGGTTGGGGGGGGVIVGPGVTPGAGCALPANTSGNDIQTVSRAFNDIAYQAVNCDLTRVMGLQWLSSGDHIPRFQFLGCSGDHHGMEHSSNGGEYIKAQKWIFEEMVKFVTMLKNTPEGNGSMLDNSIVYLASEMGNGTHILSPAMSTIIGKAGGAFRTGRRVDAQDRNINDVLLTVANTMGLNVTQVGDPEFNKGAISLS
ncbi:MAG: DUF1552 domain-containing protein [Polyangiaceae bacterium]|nr:DUF1552 domain-containing protein [Polyangiaceae bacterium]